MGSPSHIHARETCEKTFANKNTLKSTDHNKQQSVLTAHSVEGKIVQSMHPSNVNKRTGSTNVVSGVEHSNQRNCSCRMNAQTINKNSNVCVAVLSRHLIQNNIREPMLKRKEAQPVCCSACSKSYRYMYSVFNNTSMPSGSACRQRVKTIHKIFIFCSNMFCSFTCQFICKFSQLYCFRSKIVSRTCLNETTVSQSFYWMAYLKYMKSTISLLVLCF